MRYTDISLDRKSSMALPLLASSMTDDLMRRTVRMCVALEGVAWTVESVQNASKAIVRAAGFEPSTTQDYVAVEDIARNMGEGEHAVLWQLRACGFEPSEAELRPERENGSLRRARWVVGMRRRREGSPPSGTEGEDRPSSCQGRRERSPSSSSTSTHREHAENATDSLHVV